MLLQGDALTVQLFIGGAALTFLGIAMTQAGWTHKWFVRGMFSVAALLTVASLGWPYFESRIPLISDALQAIASSRIGWLFVGIIPAFVGGMLLSDYLRRRGETVSEMSLTPKEKNDLDFLLHTLTLKLKWIANLIEVFDNFQNTRAVKLFNEQRIPLERLRNETNQILGDIFFKYLPDNKEYFAYLIRVLKNDEMLVIFFRCANEYLTKLDPSSPIEAEERAAMIDVANQRLLKAAAGLGEWLMGATKRLEEMRSVLR
jgi:hypothetical protein